MPGAGRGGWTGGCSCEAVRYRLTRRPMVVHCCHCLACQRQSGSAFVINALTEAAHVTLLSGRPRAIEVPTLSGAPHVIYRCPKCFVALWSDYRKRGVLLFLRVATLDRPHAFEPDMHIYARSKVPWVGLPSTARVFDEFYDMRREWTPAMLRRREKLLGPLPT